MGPIWCSVQNWAAKNGPSSKMGLLTNGLLTHYPCQLPHEHHFPCQQPCQFTHHYCHPHHCYVISHIIFHVINVWRGKWIRDENYIMCDIYFHHKNCVWVGLWGPGRILWRFQNVMDQAINDENLRNVTRCDLWRSIHDAFRDRHRYCFMMVLKRHRSRNSWRNFKKCHEMWSVTLNTWRYLRSS